jgi:hypothetical protein
MEVTFSDIRNWYPWASDKMLREIYFEKLYLCDNAWIVHGEDKHNKKVRTIKQAEKIAAKEYFEKGKQKLKALHKQAFGGVVQLNLFVSYYDLSVDRVSVMGPSPVYYDGKLISFNP